VIGMKGAATRGSMAPDQNFLGFPSQALKFYEELSANNNREWFRANKGRYETHVLLPAQAFVITFGERLKLLSNAIEYDARTSGMGSIMRIYRDMRFSKDKTPFKTNLGIVFWEGRRKKLENPGFYFHLDSTGASLYAGLYRFPKIFLGAYRDAVIDRRLGPDLESILEDFSVGGEFEVGGEQNKRVPRGYDPEHPRARWLRQTGLWVQAPFLDPVVLSSPELVDVCFDYAVSMIPLHKWFVQVDLLVSS
jgi:uncharacterized protein (TIGR02453 family)